MPAARTFGARTEGAKLMSVVQDSVERKDLHTVHEMAYNPGRKPEDFYDEEQT
jgi:hypothetical protein